MKTLGRFPWFVPRRLAAGAAAIALVGGVAACAPSSADDPDESATTSTDGSADASTDASTETSTSGTSTSETAAAVQEAAAAFVALLDDDQLALLSYDYDDQEAKTVWSNLPVGSADSTNASDSGSDDTDTDTDTGGGPGGAPGGGGMGTARNGLALGEMTDEQQEAALAVVEALLSDQGYEQVLEIMAADDVLNADNGGNSGWSSGLYFLAFFGDPTSDDEFYIQFGGHHLAINADLSGGSVTISPEFTGVEPVTYTGDDGETVEAMGGESSALFAILDSLGDDELAAAELTTQWSDIAKGAGEDDGTYPDDEYDGVLVSSLSQEQQDLVTEAIRQWVGDLDESISDETLQAYVDAYDETYVAWSISADADDSNSYVRISGPRVWIEYSHQPGIGEAGWHIHSVYRDKQTDYDAAG